METIITLQDLETWEQSQERRQIPIEHDHADAYRAPGDVADDACGDAYISAARLG